VPDADDTAAALIALRHLGTEYDAGIGAGLRWLLDLQNRDGGIPTFCRGWGRLPFDRSCPDLTAHACAAWRTWEESVTGGSLARRLRRARCRAIAYLLTSQREDGSWLPLWFGNQGRADRANPTIGTARVLTALAEGEDSTPLDAALARGEQWLLAAQREEGGWGAGAGTPATVEETAWGVMALTRPGATAEAWRRARRGATWLAARYEQGTPAAAPLGLYFANLWYAERLYPLIWTVEALGRVAADDATARTPPDGSC
jgi:squalene-hopene/tetraprenyl-beta-curcumene cyclase